MSQVTPVQIIAAGRLLNNNGTWSTDWIRGASPTIIDGGVGIATITLDDPADAGSVTVPGTVTVVTPVATANGFWGTSSRPSDTQVRFDIWSDTNTHADNAFSFVVFQSSTTVGA